MDTDMVMATQQHENNITAFNTQKRSPWIFFALSFLSCVPLLYLFWKFREAGFGYDIGIYRRTAIEYWHAFFNPATPAFAFSAFSSLVLWLGDSLDAFLVGGYIILTFFTSFTLGVLVRKMTQSNITAVCTLILFSTSIIQFEFFSGFYYRNMLALFLLFASLLLLEYQSFLAALPLLIVTAIHPLTALIAFPTLFLIGIFQKEKRKLYFTTIAASGLLSLFLSWNEFFRYIQTLFGFLQNREATLAHSSEFTGQFIHSSQFFRFTLPYLPFALIGIFREGKKYLFWSVFGAINILLILFQFFLFERFYLFLNIAVIFFASFGLQYVFSWFENKKIFWLLTCSYASFLLCAQVFYILHKLPLISRSELQEIQQLSSHIPEKSFLLAFSSSEAPWLYGFAGNYKIIAPGTLDENKWNFDQWQEFWSTTDIKKRAALLHVYTANEIFLYAGGPYENVATQLFADDPHIHAINHSLWKYQFSP